MRDKYGISQDIYCYSGTDVLINLLNIRDVEVLEEAEIAFTTERYLSYQGDKSDISQFNFSHLKFLHLYLFQDVYEWAGKIRKVDISKGNTRFCTFSRIEPEAIKLFNNIPRLADHTHLTDLVKDLANLFCELNLLHPFREGNGRTLRFFLEEMLFVLGYEITWPTISQNDWIDANIAGVYLDLEPLIAIFTSAVQPR
ncbi:UNVERIFIED_ORG: cell filamentation protein [Providencia alcalifaciens]